MKRGCLFTLLILVVVLVIIYFFPVPQPSFEEIFAKVDEETIDSLLAFRRDYPLKHVAAGGERWEYVAAGEGEEAILFLHGMSGAYDIWWQQMLALSDDYKVIALTYPPAGNLEDMAAGILAVLDQEGVGTTNLVGSSLGGYVSQYLVANYPDRFQRAVFANTFPPNDRIAEQNWVNGLLLPFLPEWAVMAILRQSTEGSIYPASGHSELVRAYMLEQSYGRMSKAQFLARFKNVVEPFTPPDIEQPAVPLMIIEADNDPLVEEILREQLKTTYPVAAVNTLHDVGHFSYLNEPEMYTELLRDFFAGN